MKYLGANAAFALIIGLTATPARGSDLVACGTGTLGTAASAMINTVPFLGLILTEVHDVSSNDARLAHKKEFVSDPDTIPMGEVTGIAAAGFDLLFAGAEGAVLKYDDLKRKLSGRGMSENSRLAIEEAFRQNTHFGFTRGAYSNTAAIGTETWSKCSSIFHSVQKPLDASSLSSRVAGGTAPPKTTNLVP